MIRCISSSFVNRSIGRSLIISNQCPRLLPSAFSIPPCKSTPLFCAGVSSFSSSSSSSSDSLTTILHNGRDLLLRLRSLTPTASALSVTVFDKIKSRSDESLMNNYLLDGYSSLHTLSDWIRFTTALFHRRFDSSNLQQTSKSAIEDAHLLVFGVLGLPFALADLSLQYHLSPSSSSSPPPFLSSRLTSSERDLLFFSVYGRLFYNIPSAYIAGRTQYCNMEFLVDERAIIPRSFIGEFLVMEDEKYQQLKFSESADEAVEPVLFQTNGLPFSEVSSILDLCTGNGSLAVVASRVFPEAAIDAVDISPSALEVAKANIIKHYQFTHNRIQLFQGDLFDGLNSLSIPLSPHTPHSSLTRPHPSPAQKKYEIILCNPPYLSSERMASLNGEYLSEPSLALAGGSGDGYDGLEIPRKIIENAGKYLTENGVLIMEIGNHSEEAIEKLLENYHWRYLELIDGSVGDMVLIHKLNNVWKKSEAPPEKVEAKKKKSSSSDAAKAAKTIDKKHK